MENKDRRLGMDRPITRRDFIHDVGLATLGMLAPGGAAFANVTAGNKAPANHYYPPVRTGLRGAHAGAFEVAHALAREGASWQDVPPARDGIYDLIVVGGGISGLAAAHFYRERHGPDSRVLILDNHDDFGGHAKRNEFHQGGPMRLAWGGSVNLEFPGYSEVAAGLLDQLGVDIPRLLKGLDFDFNSMGRLKPCLYFDAETYGRDELITRFDIHGAGAKDYLSVLKRFPLGDADRISLQRFFSRSDVASAHPEVRSDAFQRKTSYWDFLTGYGGVTPAAAMVFQNAAHGLWALNADNVALADALDLGLPGAHITGERAARGEAAEHAEHFAMFPDGNASVARLLVRSLIPAVAPGAGMDDIVSAHFDYGCLDDAESAVRLRLNSTVVNARNAVLGDSKAGVEVSYIRDGEALRVQGRDCVLACYNRMIPHLCPELPEAQKEGLSYLVKHPLLVSNVLMRTGEAAHKLGIGSAYCPGRLQSTAWLVGGVEVGDYRPGLDPSQPAIMQFFGSLGGPPAGLTARESNKATRARMLALSFADYERDLRGTLGGLLGPGGFDPEKDILGITVNRWPHGYAYEYLSLYDPEWPEGEAPHEIGRQRCGHIAIANSDAGISAYVDSAIDQAWRAVTELADA